MISIIFFYLDLLETRVFAVQRLFRSLKEIDLKTGIKFRENFYSWMSCINPQRIILVSHIMQSNNWIAETSFDYFLPTFVIDTFEKQTRLYSNNKTIMIDLYFHRIETDWDSSESISKHEMNNFSVEYLPLKIGKQC
jgi:hypothetical protein